MAERDDPRAALQPLDVEANLRAANQRLRRELATARDALRRAELERDVARAGLAAAIPLLGEASVSEVRAAMLLHQPRPALVAAMAASTAPEPGQRVAVIDPAGPDRPRQIWRYNPGDGHWEIQQPDGAVFIGPVDAAPDPHPERGNWTHIGWLSPDGVSFTTSKTGTTGEGAGATAGGSAAADGRGAAVAPLPAVGVEEAGGPAADGPVGVAEADRPAGAAQRGEGGGRVYRGVRELGRKLRDAR